MTHVVFAATLAFAFFGCQSAQAPAPQAPVAPCAPLDPTVVLTATDRVNAAASGEGRPVQVRIYQLRSDARLRNASFEEIWQTDAAVLEKDLVKVEEHTLYPGETKTLPVALGPDTQHLALVALFREPQGKDWFISHELVPPSKQPPCATQAPRIPVWLDRMQLQDGAGRESESGVQ